MNKGVKLVSLSLGCMFLGLAIGFIGTYVFNTIIPGAVAACVYADTVMVIYIRGYMELARKPNKSSEEIQRLREWEIDSWFYGTAAIVGNCVAAYYCLTELGLC